jgi:hypothetical protein
MDYSTIKIMARQDGVIKLTGQMGGISFYKSKDGHLVRMKGGIDSDRIKNDPALRGRVKTEQSLVERARPASYCVVRCGC